MSDEYGSYGITLLLKKTVMRTWIFGTLSLREIGLCFNIIHHDLSPVTTGRSITGSLETGIQILYNAFCGKFKFLLIQI